MLRINELNKGDRVRLVDFGETPILYRRKLLSLGLTNGAEVLVVRFAPLGCPMQIEVKGTAISIRKEEASHLIWEQL